MDKETEQHLKEYRKHIAEWKERIHSTTVLIADILKAEESEEGEIHRAEHDFPNFAKYNKGTDV